MSEQEMKPCPFCGDTSQSDDNAPNREDYLECPACGARGPQKATRAETKAAWNQRARSHLAEMIAGGCGHRGPIHTNECSDECGWFAFWDTDNDADFENRVNCCVTEEEAIVALLEKTKAELVALRQEKQRLAYWAKLLDKRLDEYQVKASALDGEELQRAEDAAELCALQVEIEPLRALREAVDSLVDIAGTDPYCPAQDWEDWGNMVVALAACDARAIR